MSKNEKKNESNVTIIVAVLGLIGTIVTAVLTSPLLIKMIENSPTAEASASESPVVQSPDAQPAVSFGDPVLIFSEDFEDGSASGFGFDGDAWQIGKDKSNKTLEVDTTSFSENQWTSASFGPTDFSSGIIEFKVKYEKIGGLYTVFRAGGDSYYVFYLTPTQTILGIKEKAQDWNLAPFTDNTVKFFTAQTGVWYAVKIDARGADVTVSIDGNKLFTGNDSRLQSGRLEFMLGYGTKAMLDDVQVWSFGQ